MNTTALLPPEIAAKTNRWFGRARNYPIYSLPWLRYRSVSMLIGSALMIALGVALLGGGPARGPDRAIDAAKVLEGSLAYFVTAAAAILAGPALAVGVRTLRLRPHFETLLIAAVLGLGMFVSFGIVQKETMRWYARGSYDSRHDVMVNRRLHFVFDVEFRRRPPAARSGLLDPNVAAQYVAAYDNYARKFGLPDRIEDGWPRFMTNEDRRLLARMRDPALSDTERRALEGRYVDLLEKVYGANGDIWFRGLRRHPAKTMTLEQKRAESQLLASLDAEAPPPAVADE